MTRLRCLGRHAVLAALLATATLAGCAAPDPTGAYSSFPPIGGGSGTPMTAAPAQAAPVVAPVTRTSSASSNQVQAAPLAAPTVAMATRASSASSDQGIQAQIAAFRDICGHVARTGAIGEAQQAATQAGFQPVGTSRRGAFGFTSFSIFDNGQGLQVQLSNAPFPFQTRQAMCGVVARDAQGSDGIFQAAGNALAAANGRQAQPKPFLDMDETGKLDFQLNGRTVRMDWQQRPFGLVLYTMPF